MTGPEHYLAAERLTDTADAWMNADHGWQGQLSVEERLSRRMADLAAAQVHATLAAAAATALSNPPLIHHLDADAWRRAASETGAGR